MPEADTTPAARRFGKGWWGIGILGALLVAFALFRIAAAQRLQSKIDDLKADSRPGSAAELDDYYKPVQDPSQNAALAIMEALMRIEAHAAYVDSQESRYKDRFWDHWNGDKPLEEAEAEAFRDLTSAMIAEIAEVKAAAALPESRYSADLSAGHATILPHLSKIRSLSRVLRYEAIAGALEGDSERAIEAVEAGFDLGHSLRNEPLLISGLVRIAGDVITVQTLQGVVATVELSDDQRSRVVEKMKRAMDAKPMALGMIGEAAVLPDTMSDLAALAGVGGSHGAPSGISLEAAILFVYGLTGLADVDAAYGLGRIESMYQVIKERDPARRAVERRASSIDDPIPKYYIGARMLLPALSSSIKKEDGWQAMLATAIQALDPSGESYPDPRSGGELTTLDIEGRRYFCSLGPDGVDNGIGDPSVQKHRTDDQYFFVPIRNADGAVAE